MYYETLDQTRDEVLKLEYILRNEIDLFENQLTTLLDKTKELKLSDFKSKHQDLNE